jgi:hypothetical protein
MAVRVLPSLMPNNSPDRTRMRLGSRGGWMPSSVLAIAERAVRGRAPGGRPGGGGTAAGYGEPGRPVPPCTTVHYLRIWTDDAGETHQSEVDLGVTVTPREPGVAELVVGDAGTVGRLHFVTVRAGGQQPDWHNAPRRQFVTFLTGSATIETSDGDRRTLPPGSTVLADDLTGRGHVTTHEPGDQRVLVIWVDGES